MKPFNPSPRNTSEPKDHSYSRGVGLGRGHPLAVLESKAHGYPTAVSEHSGKFTKNIQDAVPFYRELLNAGFLIRQNP
jgi:hypothetical protein